MNQYEVMYVIDAALEDSARIELIDRFSDLEALRRPRSRSSGRGRC